MRRVKRTMKAAPQAMLGEVAVDHYTVSRKRMVAEQLMARGIRDIRTLEAMLHLPRHLFVDPGLHPLAYQDRPLQLGELQTISQPYIVAFMLEALELQPGDRVLEVGTGSGYLTALLSLLVDQVFSIERLPNLLFRARRVLKGLNYRNITLRVGDGTVGWPERGPYQAIVVSAGGPQIPQPYLEQLAEGGRLVLPVGDAHSQVLHRVRKTGSRYEVEPLKDCRFVKLKGRYGFQSQ